MGKIDYFSIVFHKPDPVFFHGETILGDVKLQVNQRLKINCLKCLIKGFSRVHWLERVNKKVKINYEF